MKPKIKIYGERNTGTRYLHELISENLEADLLTGVVPKKWRRIFRGSETAKDLFFKFTFPNNLGWKHTLVEPSKLKHMKVCQNLIFITITKNPYSWLLSLYKRPYHSTIHSSSIDDFLSTPWETVGRENAPRGFADPIDMWNKKNAAYCELQKASITINLKYEDILANPISILETLSQKFSIQKKNGSLNNIKESTKESKKDFSYYQDFYLHEKWKEKLSQSTISKINKHLDKSTMHYFGYEKLGMKENNNTV